MVSRHVQGPQCPRDFSIGKYGISSRLLLFLVLVRDQVRFVLQSTAVVDVAELTLRIVLLPRQEILWREQMTLILTRVSSFCRNPLIKSQACDVIASINTHVQMRITVSSVHNSLTNDSKSKPKSGFSDLNFAMTFDEIDLILDQPLAW